MRAGMAICYSGHTAVASLLLEREADIHSRDNNERTALHFACTNGRTAVASLLLERGADIHSRTNNGWTALHRACSMYGQKDIAILLIESKADIYIKRNDGKTPLDFMPSEWRKELTYLYNTVNRAWLARKSFLFVLIGCGHVESESNKNNASMQTRSGEGGGSSSRVTRSVTRVRARELRDEVLRSVNMSIMSYL